MANRRIVIEFLGKDVSAGSAAAKVEQRFGKLGGRLDKVGQAAGKVLAGGVALGGAALYKMSQSAAEDEAAQVRLAGALKRSGGATDEQVAAAERWIEAQGKALGVTDDELRPALAKLTVATGDVEKAQKLSSLAMDVAQGRGKSLASVSDALAKAQQGNLSGLQRLGVETKKSNGETKSLAEVTRDLAETYGGAAAKNAETAAGRQQILTTRLGELGEKIGASVLPAMERMTETGLKLTEWVSGHTRLVGTLVAIAGGLAATLYAVSLAMRAWTTATKVWSAITKVATAVQTAFNFVMAMNPIGLVVLAIAALVVALVIAYKKSETFRKIVNAAFGAVAKAAKVAFGWVKDKAVAAFNWIKDNWKTLLAILTGPIGIAVLVISKNWDKIKAGASKAVSWVKDKFGTMVAFFKGLPSRITSAASGMWDGITNAFRSMLNRIIALWNGLSFTIPSVNTHIPGVGSIGGFTLSTPNIPYLAKGGIVNKPTLAVLGERGPEAVVPLSRMGSMGQVHVHFHGPVLGGNESLVARELGRILLADKRLSGRSALAGL